MDISGHWIGTYIQPFRKAGEGTPADLEDSVFKIEAWIETQGDAFTGRMLDFETTRESLYADVVMAQRSLLGGRERGLEDRFLDEYPDARYRTSLSPDSTLQGTLKGRDVSFTKTYSRPGEYTLIFAGRESTTAHGRTIFYSGELSADGNRIEGFYRTSKNPLSRASRLKEPFTLIRQ